MATSANWYTRNASRSFPFSLNASLVDDTGKQLPELVVADLQIRFPGGVDSRCYLSRFQLSDHAVSLAISRDLPDVATVATVTIARQDFQAHSVYQLVASTDNTTGLVVFGDLDNIDDGDWVFTDPAASEFVRDAYEAVSLPIVNRFGFIGQSSDIRPLSLTGQGDVRVEQTTANIGGVERSIVQISLVNNLDVEGRDVLAVYAGKCGQRPESRTCDDPQPIETIAGIQPDCCGRVFIEFRGCGEMLPLDGNCGVAINCQTSVDDTCPAPTNVPGEDGRLPNEFPDECDTAGPTFSQQDENVRDRVEDPPSYSRVDYRRFL